MPDSDIAAAHIDCPQNANAEGEHAVPVRTAKLDYNHSVIGAA
jgi:hypothetical protein